MKANEIFTMSKDGKSEYCCNVVRIGEIKPIEGKDKIATTIINGETIVIRKDQVKEGDVMFYASNECQLNAMFLSKNNLYEIGERERNSNAVEVCALMDEGKVQEAKSKVGYFNKHGRVRMIRLGGVLSMGYLFSKEEVEKFCPKVADVNIEDIINKDFDTINGELFVKAYVPPVKEQRSGGGRGAKVTRKAEKKFDRLVPGEFAFHYDTQPLAKNMYRINHDNVVDISVKLHGTSAIIANVKTKIPINLPWYKRFINWFKAETFPTFYIDYGDVYASRTVIKNKSINKNQGGGYYNSDIWGEYNELLKGKLPKDTTIYGEICGYLTGSQSMIQKGYDYGCKEGENFLMIYRITTNLDTGKYEWNPQEVKEFAEKLVKEYPELEDRIMPIPILYHGRLDALYPYVSTFEHWHENILQELQNDSEHFGMEQQEPLNIKPMPREGICLRIENDPVAECFKLKCKKFLEKEAKAIDKGEVDIEMINTDY